MSFACLGNLIRPQSISYQLLLIDDSFLDGARVLLFRIAQIVLRMRFTTARSATDTLELTDERIIVVAIERSKSIESISAHKIKIKLFIWLV